MVTDEAEAGLVEFLYAVQAQLGRLALVLTGDREQAEDLTQDVLVKVIASWHRIRRTTDPAAYACRMMINQRRDDARRDRRNREYTLRDSLLATDLERVLDRLTLKDALTHLTAKQRVVLYLRFYEDLSVRDVALRMGTTDGTVKSQTYDALRAVAKISSIRSSKPTRA